MRPPLVLAAAVGVGYAASARSGDARDPALSITREFGEGPSEPGEEVRVVVTARNVGDVRVRPISRRAGRPAVSAVALALLDAVSLLAALRVREG